MEKTVGCIIVRTGSTRLPKKAILKIKGKTLIEYLIIKMKRVKNFNSLYICTTIDPSDKILLKIAKNKKINSYTGSKTNVVDRILKVAEIENAKHIARITGDNPFCDEIFMNEMIEIHIKHGVDYTKTVFLPIGVSAEIYSVKGLRELYTKMDPNEDYLSYYLYFIPNNLKKLILIPPKKFQQPYFSLTVDTQEDFIRTKFIINNIKNPNGYFLDDILNLNEKTPIPNLIIEKNTKIKIPNNEKMLFEEYHEFLKSQYQKFKKIDLDKDFYEKNKFNLLQ